MKKQHITIKRLTFAALMCAMSIVIGIICKNLLTYAVYYRITFENMPIILAAFLLGPVYGVFVGVGADIISCLCSTNPAVNPIITLGAASVGLISGIIPMIFRKRNTFTLALSVSLSHVIGQVAIKSVAKILYFGMPKIGILIGLGFSVFAGSVEFILIRLILKNQALKKQLDKLN